MRKANLILTASALILSTSCRPTVDNYKEAYDVALQKDKGDLDDEIYQKIKAEERPKVVVVGNDSIYTKIEPLSLYKADAPLLPVDYKFNVVVGRYKMVVNANAHCERLKQDGYNSYLVKNTESEYYVVASGFHTIEEAAETVRRLNKKYSGRFVGIEAPIVVTPSHLMKRY